jgi:branched-chain amino acid transport system permease protein
MLQLMVTQVLNGICIGLIYTLVALGLSIILGLRGVINFTHGAGYLLGGYIAFTLVELASFNFWASLLPCLVGGGTLGLVIFFAIVKPLEKRPPLEPMVALIGLNMIFVQIARTIWGAEYKPLSVRLGSVELKLGDVSITYPEYFLVAMAAAVVLVCALYFLFHRTDIGIRCLACIQNKDVVQCLGVNADRIGLFIFIVGMGLAALGGALAAPIFSVYPTMGDELLLLLFIIVIVGGLGSIGGTLVAGVGIALVKAVAAVFVSGNLATIITFSILIFVLLFRPRGIMGAEKVLE